MPIREQIIEIAIGDRRVAGTAISPSVIVPGVLFVHGWAGDQSQYLARAREVGALGCFCLTFDLYGHAKTSPYLSTVSREDNLNDVVAAYDYLTNLPLVDKAAIAVV